MARPGQGSGRPQVGGRDVQQFVVAQPQSGQPHHLGRGQARPRTGLSQRGSERVAQSVGMSTVHARAGPVVPEHRAQPLRAQRLAPGGALGDHEQPGGVGIGALGQQVSLDQPGHLDVKRDTAFLVAFAEDPDPASGDVHIADDQAQHLTRTQPREQHQPGDRLVPPRPETVQQRAGLTSVQALR